MARAKKTEAPAAAAPALHVPPMEAFDSAELQLPADGVGTATLEAPANPREAEVMAQLIKRRIEEGKLEAYLTAQRMVDEAQEFMFE